MRNTNTEVCPSAATFPEVTWLSTNSVVRTASAVVRSPTTAILASKSEVFDADCDRQKSRVVYSLTSPWETRGGEGGRERERKRERLTD